MLTVDGDDAFQRLRDTVNAERLVGCGVVGLCLDDALLGDKLIVLTAHRVFEQALGHTVSLLGNFAGNGVRQHSKTKCRKVRSVGQIKHRDHEYHLLPGIKIPPRISPWWLNENELLVD